MNTTMTTPEYLNALLAEREALIAESRTGLRHRTERSGRDIRSRWFRRNPANKAAAPRLA